MTPDELDILFKALADPTRRRIVDRLAERPDQSLFELCAAAAVAEGQPVLQRPWIVPIPGTTKLHRLELAPLKAAQKAWLGRHL